MKHKINKFSLYLFGLFSLIVPNGTFAAGAGPFTTMFGGSCSTYGCWISKVWDWATAIIIPLAVIVIVAAGIIYMTSGGNPDRIGLAKKMILGALSGVALLLLARIFLVNFLFGTENKIWWNV